MCYGRRIRSLVHNWSLQVFVLLVVLGLLRLRQSLRSSRFLVFVVIASAVPTTFKTALLCLRRHRSNYHTRRIVLPIFAGTSLCYVGVTGEPENSGIKVW